MKEKKRKDDKENFKNISNRENKSPRKSRGKRSGVVVWQRWLMKEEGLRVRESVRFKVLRRESERDDKGDLERVSEGEEVRVKEKIRE